MGSEPVLYFALQYVAFCAAMAIPLFVLFLAGVGIGLADISVNARRYAADFTLPFLAWALLVLLTPAEERLAMFGHSLSGGSAPGAILGIGVLVVRSRFDKKDRLRSRLWKLAKYGFVVLVAHTAALPGD